MKDFFKHLKGDAFGGITAGIVALPLALAFGVSSGLGPAAGLYGAVFIAFFAALFGGTGTQISGPTAPMTAVSTLVVAGIVAGFNGDVEKALPAILTVFLLGGVFQIILGISGVGKYIKYIPYPVVSGFMTAIGVMIIVTQILPALGYYPAEDPDLVNSFTPEAKTQVIQNLVETNTQDATSIADASQNLSKLEEPTSTNTLEEAKALAKNFSSGTLGALKVIPYAIKKINYIELLLALATIFIIYGFKRITKKIPSTLVALLVVSGVAYFTGIDYRAIQEIPSGFPLPNFGIITEFNYGSIAPYIFYGVSLAFLGAIDSLLTSIVADNMTKTRHNPSKELVGQGIGNTIASIFGGIPGAGATIRTVVNINAGGRTKLSGMIAGILLLIILLALGPVASKIPAGVLAGILITVGIGVMDYKGLRAIPNLPKDIDLKMFKLSSEVLIMFIVLILSAFWNLINAVGIGLILSSLIFMKKMGDFTARRSSVTDLKSTKENELLWKDEANFPTELSDSVFIKHLSGPLFFGYTSEFQQLSKQIPATAKHAILRMDKVPYIDQSGIYAMEDTILMLEQNGVNIHLVGLQKQPQYMMERIDIIPDLISKDNVFSSFDDCITYLKTFVKDPN